MSLFCVCDLHPRLDGCGHSRLIVFVDAIVDKTVTTPFEFWNGAEDNDMIFVVFMREAGIVADHTR